MGWRRRPEAMEQFQHIADKINRILSEEYEVDIDRITPSGNLRQVIDLDSLDYVDLVVIIENNFSIKVKPEDLAGVITFKDFYGYVVSQIHGEETGV